MKSDRALTFVEIDIPYCTLRYGEGACTAVLGADSDIKCFNTFATCAKRSVFNEGMVTLRFAVDATYLVESGIEAIPAITNVTYDPVKISLGEKSLGARAKLSVTLRDFPHNDTGTGFDKYRSERPYDPARQGTFWGKFRARHPILNGRPIRLIRGVVGQTLAEMETRHLFIDGLDTSEDGSVTIVGKDVLKLADGDRALAPRPSTGYIIADISTGTTSVSLGPAGIGNAEYPPSGYLAIGGKEIVAFTRVGDALTLTRGQFETAAVAHKAQDRAQLCLYYEGQDVADILSNLCISYAGMPSSQIPIDDWKDETAAYLRRVYTAMIAEPTPVRELMAELVEQAALTLIPDDVTQRVRLQVLRAIPTDAGLWAEENIGQGSLRIRDQPNKRITNCVTYFGLINPLEDVDDPKNYRSVEAYDATDFDIENQPRIKRIYSRWIPAFGRTIASRLNAIQIGRYNRAPRQFTFDSFRTMPSELGRGYRLEYWPLQLPTGERESVPIQVVGLRSSDAWYTTEAEEAHFLEIEEVDLTNRVIIIDGGGFNLNLRSIHNSLFPALVEDDTVTFIINSGVAIGSTSITTYAVDVGTWPAWLVPTIKVRGRIQGRGGVGGRGGSNGGPGHAAGNGGPALRVRHPVVLDFTDGGGEIFGGGGGAGGGAGGGRSFGGGGGGGGAGTPAGGGGAGGGGTYPGQAGGNGGADDGGVGGARRRHTSTELRSWRGGWRSRRRRARGWRVACWQQWRRCWRGGHRDRRGFVHHLSWQRRHPRPADQLGCLLMVMARWTGTVQDAAGNAIAGALVEVRREGDNTLAPLFSDRAGEEGLGNPFTANEATIFFHVEGGAYRVKATLGDFEREWRYVAVGLGQERDDPLEGMMQTDADGGDPTSDEAVPSVARVASLIAERSLSFAAKSDVENAVIPDAAERLWMPRAGVELVAINTPSVVKPWHVQSDNGRYFDMRFPDGRVSLHAWAGANQGIDFSTDDTDLFQYAADYINRAWWETSGGAAQGRFQRGCIYVPPGAWTIDPTDPVIAYDFMKLIGAGNGQSLIKAANTSAGSLIQRPATATYNSSQRTTHCEVAGLRLILTGANQTALDLAHSGRLLVHDNLCSRQDRVDEWTNANQSVLSGTRFLRLRNSDSVMVGGDIATVDRNHVYFIDRAVESGNGGGVPGPEKLRIIGNEFSDCSNPIVINSYGGAGGEIANNVIQRWLAGSRAIDLVGRYWTIRENYLESITNTNGPILLRTGSLRCTVHRLSHVNYTNHTASSGPPVVKSLGNNDGTNCVDEFGTALAATFVGHPVP